MSTTMPLYYRTDYNFSGTTTTTQPPPTDLGNSFVPVGTILLYSGTKLPVNYLWCDGTSFSTTTYSTLHSVIGDTYGTTSTGFRVPNMLKHIPIGADSISNMTISYTGPGGINNTKNGGNSTIVTNQLAQHVHNNPSNTNFIINTNTPGYRVDNAGNSNYIIDIATETGGIQGLSSTQQEILPPFTVVNYIIKYQ
jgi:microcystin-dependent protein